MPRLAVDVTQRHGSWTFEIEDVLGTELPVGQLQSCAERSRQPFTGEVTQVVAAIAIEVRDLSQPEFVRGVHQLLRFSQHALRGLHEQDRFVFSQDGQVIQAVAVEIARRHEPLRRRGVGNALLLLLCPRSRFGLKADNELIGAAEVDDVSATVAVEVAQRDGGNLLIDRQLDVFKPPVIFHDVHVGRSRFPLARRGGDLSLNQQIEPTLAVIDEQHVGLPIVIQVSRQQIGRTL